MGGSLQFPLLGPTFLLLPLRGAWGTSQWEIHAFPNVLDMLGITESLGNGSRIGFFFFFGFSELQELLKPGRELWMFVPLS